MTANKKPIPLKRTIAKVTVAAWIFTANTDKIYFVADSSHRHNGRMDWPTVYVDLEEKPGEKPQPQVHLGISADIIHREILYHPTIGERADVYLSLEQAQALAKAILRAVEAGKQAKESQAPG